MVSFTSLFFFKSLLSLLNIASVFCFLFLFFFSGRKVCGILGLPGGSDSKESACNAGDPGLIPGSGRPPGEGKGYPLQYSCLENPMDRGAWRLQSAGLHRVGRDWATNIFTFTLCGLLTPCPGAEPAPLALEGEGKNPWTVGEGPTSLFLQSLISCLPTGTQTP